MKNNFEELVFYQIYPKSFCDGDGDGLGDFKGIISKIDYLKSLGVNAVWITPCFKSPNVDNGYDISDYRDTQDDMGTLSEAEEMIKEFHRNGIAVIFDLVANHSSTEHKWFKESRKSKDNPYRDYYIWRETPPNDWYSLFGGKAWKYDEQTNEYYLHSFAVEQADLNWDNPKVREEMKAVVDYWIDKGVDGFRCDVLDMISKDWVLHKNGNGPHMHEYIRELFDRETTNGIFTVGECWSADAENVKSFCKKDRKELTTVFAFQHLCVDNGRFCTDKPIMKEVCRSLSDWQELLQESDILPTLFFENHDQPRSVSRFGDDINYRYESATMLGSLILTLRGIPFIYQGEEVGITNSWHNQLSDFIDIESVNYCNLNKDRISYNDLLSTVNYCGRDNARHMIPWNESTKSVWIAPYSRQGEINVAKDLSSEKPIYNFYKELINLRKTESALKYGKYNLIELNDNYYIYSREYEGEKITIVVNFDKISKLELNYGKVLLTNYDSVNNELKPYQAVIYKN